MLINLMFLVHASGSYIPIRLRRHVHGVNTKELLDAWSNKDKRILSEQFENAPCVCICWFLVPAWLKTLTLQIMIEVNK